MQPTRKLWQWLGVVFLLSFAALGWMGREIYLAAPPIPKAVVSLNGTTLYTGDEIQRGQQAWLSAGGQQLGTVWGHGSYVAPDWSADWLHREAVALRERLAQKTHGAGFDALTSTQQAAIEAQLKQEMRRNTYDAGTATIAVSAERAQAIAATAAHYTDLFGHAPALAKLRDQYAMTDGTLPNAEDRQCPRRILLLVVVGRHDRPACARRGFPTPATGRTSRSWATR